MVITVFVTDYKLQLTMLQVNEGSKYDVVLVSIKYDAYGINFSDQKQVKKNKDKKTCS